MKKILFLSMLFITTISFAEVPLSPTIQKARQFRSDLVQKQDELLELLLQIPFEQRQYVFPMLSANQSMPKKIKTHPEVVVWKGKRPTRIADRFKDDEELLQYLPEQFYYTLAPELWPSENSKVLEANPNQLLKNMIISQQNSVEELPIMPEELMIFYDGLNVLQKFVQETSTQPESPIYFEKWINKIPATVQKRIKEKTNLSPDHFGKSIDNIAKNYRLYQKQRIPESSHEQKLVQEYWSLIPFIFEKTGFKDALNSKIYQD